MPELAGPEAKLNSGLCGTWRTSSEGDPGHHRAGLPYIYHGPGLDGPSCFGGPPWVIRGFTGRIEFNPLDSPEG